MATLTIRNLDDQVKRELQIRAAHRGRSMEAEARAVLTESVQPRSADDRKENLGMRIHRRFAALGGVELQIPLRTKSHRQIPTFD